MWRVEAANDDENIEDDQRTMRMLRQIVDLIHPMLQFEEDYPSNYPDGKIPNLDLKYGLA